MKYYPSVPHVRQKMNSQPGHRPSSRLAPSTSVAYHVLLTTAKDGVNDLVSRGTLCNAKAPDIFRQFAGVCIGILLDHSPHECLTNLPAVPVSVASEDDILPFRYLAEELIETGTHRRV